MGQAPSTVAQLALMILAVLPGVTYQFLRERWRGPVPGERDLGERVLRSVTASLVLDAVYLVVAGPQLFALARGTSPGGWNGLVEHPRLIGAVALTLFVVVPALAAVGVSWGQRRQLHARYRGTPTAWDHAFRDRGPCFVRVRFKDGTWVGGWYGTTSYATSYPNPTEVYLQSAWRMNPDGSFHTKVDHTAGLYIRGQDIDLLELLNPLSQPGSDTEALR